MRHQTPGLFLIPQPVADARLGPPGPATPLFRRGSADLDRRQPGQAAGGFEPRHPRQAAVDHHPHPLDGQTGLGHRGRQHHLAPARRRRIQGPVLLGLVQRAVQGHHLDRRIAQPGLQGLDGAVNLALPRQEGQDRARLLAQGLDHRPGHGVFQPFQRVAAGIAGLDREHPALRFNDRGPVQQPGHPDDVQRRRHDQQAQILAQHRLAVPRQRQTEVGVQAAFVKFVEQHRPDSVQSWVVEDHPGEDPLGDHLDPRLRADPGLQPGPIADGLAGGLPQGLCHPVRGGPRRQPPRLQHQNSLPRQPWLVQQGQRYDRGLARARRRGEDHGIPGRKRGFQRLENGMNGQHPVGLAASGGNGKAPHRLAVPKPHCQPPPVPLASAALKAVRGGLAAF